MSCKNSHAELEEWMGRINHYFVNRENLVFNCIYENENYYAEASSFITFKKISIWEKTLNTEKIKLDKKSPLVSDDCSICLSKLKKKSVLKVTSCGHVFHKKCLEKYISTIHNSDTVPLCPLCRSGNADSLKQIEERKHIWSDLFTYYERDSDCYESD